MQYFDERGKAIPYDQVDTAHGWLETKETVHHDEVPAKMRTIERVLEGGFKLTVAVEDVPAQPAWDEVVSQIYHYTGPTKAEQMEAELMELKAQVTVLHSVSEQIPGTVQSKIDESMTPLQEAIAEVYELMAAGEAGV